MYFETSTYSKEIIVINTKYSKQIVLLGNDYKIATEIWNYYKENKLTQKIN